MKAIFIQCSNCGGDLIYSPDKNAMSCHHCNSVFIISTDNKPITESEYELFIRDSEEKFKSFDIKVVSCSNCKAEISFDTNIISDECPFCGVALVLKEGSASKIIKTFWMMPFKIDREKAEQMFNDWVSKLHYVPSGLMRRLQRKDKLNPMFIPYWLFELDAVCEFKIRKSKNTGLPVAYQPVELTDVHFTDKRTLVGKYSGPCNDILIPGSKVLSEKHLKNLEPWNFEMLEPFEEKFLSGIRTEVFQVDIMEGIDHAFSVAKLKLLREMRNRCNEFYIGIFESKAYATKISFKYMLLPVWISTFRFKNKTFRFIINGVTGEVQGERPLNGLKVALTIIGLGVGVALSILLSLLLFRACNHV